MSFNRGHLLRGSTGLACRLMERDHASRSNIRPNDDLLLTVRIKKGASYETPSFK